MADENRDDDTRDTARLRDRTSDRQKIPGPEPLPVTGETEPLARTAEPPNPRRQSIEVLIPAAIILLLAIAIAIVALV